MIDKHLIIKENNEEILILFLNFNYEFGGLKRKSISFKKNIIKYIKNNNIRFKGSKILLVVAGIIIGTLLYMNNNTYIVPSNEKINYVDQIITKNLNVELINKSIAKESEVNKEEIKLDDISKEKVVEKVIPKQVAPKIEVKEKTEVKEQSKVEENKEEVKQSPEIVTVPKEMVTIYRSNGNVISIELEEYLIGVLAEEMPASFNIEALKAQAIISRTYALKRIKDGKRLTDTVDTQRYIDINQMKAKWGNEFNKYYEKIKTAVTTTSGIYITYNNSYIDAVYHSTSNGHTEDALEVWGYNIPYLKSVESYWDKNASSYLRTIEKDIGSILQIFNIVNLDKIEIVKRDTSGRVSEVKVNDNVYSGVDIRELLGLRSTDFDIQLRDNKLIITTRGYGHGVGMSQYGANGMANDSYNYEQIIKHYYTGVTINKK